jgi:hypothetical protein
MTEDGEVFLGVWNGTALHSSSLEEAAFASSPLVNHSSCRKNKEERKNITIVSNEIKATSILQF